MAPSSGSRSGFRLRSPVGVLLVVLGLVVVGEGVALLVLPDRATASSVQAQTAKTEPSELDLLGDRVGRRQVAWLESWLAAHTMNLATAERVRQILVLHLDRLERLESTRDAGAMALEAEGYFEAERARRKRALQLLLGSEEGAHLDTLVAIYWDGHI